MSPIKRRLLILPALAAGFIAVPAAADNCSTACEQRVKARAFAENHGGCRSARCVSRVRYKRAAREMARYRRNPMPRCTWHGESGAHLSEWSPVRYRAKNPTSTAGGKFQIIDSTWDANGGRRYPVRHPAAAAPRHEQERVARRVLRSQGLDAWVLC